MPLIPILVGVFFFCIVIWAARTLMAAWSIGEPIASTIYVLLVVLFAFWLASQFGYGSTSLRWR